MNAPARIVERTQQPTQFSVDEFMAIVEAGVFRDAGKVELVDGAIVRMSPPQSRHMRYVRTIMYALHEVYQKQGSFVVQPELSLQLQPRTLRVVDIGVLPDFDFSSRFPSVDSVVLAIEVADSSLPADLGDKRSDYATAGIPHYWVVDVNGQRSHIMSTPLDGDYAERHLVAFGEPLDVPGSDQTIIIE